jgi:hypothetical protein
MAYCKGHGRSGGGSFALQVRNYRGPLLSRPRCPSTDAPSASSRYGPDAGTFWCPFDVSETAAKYKSEWIGVCARLPEADAEPCGGMVR